LIDAALLRSIASIALVILPTVQKITHMTLWSNMTILWSKSCSNQVLLFGFHGKYQAKNMFIGLARQLLKVN